MRWDDSTDGGGPAAQAYEEFATDFAGFLHRALSSDRWSIWVAEVDGRLVAHIYLQIVVKVPRPGRFAARWGYVSAVYTVPEARNQGIGSRLLRGVIGWAKEEGLELVLLWPSERSVPFYERAGFVRSRDILELYLDS